MSSPLWQLNEASGRPYLTVDIVKSLALEALLEVSGHIGQGHIRDHFLDPMSVIHPYHPKGLARLYLRSLETLKSLPESEQAWYLDSAVQAERYFVFNREQYRSSLLLSCRDTIQARIRLLGGTARVGVVILGSWAKRIATSASDFNYVTIRAHKNDADEELRNRGFDAALQEHLEACCKRRYSRIGFPRWSRFVYFCHFSPRNTGPFKRPGLWTSRYISDTFPTCKRWYYKFDTKLAG